MERIRFSGLYCFKFTFKPFPGEFRVGLAPAGRKCGAADDEFFIPDRDRDIVKNMGKGKCAASISGILR